MDPTWSWKEGVQFALAGEFLLANGISHTYRKSALETFGVVVLRPAYALVDWWARHIRKPHAIILATLLASLISLIAFYNIPAILFLGKVLPPKVIRFLFFFYAELNFLALGCRAFGRFNNDNLVDDWKTGKLIPIFPGDRLKKT